MKLLSRCAAREAQNRNILAGLPHRRKAPIELAAPAKIRLGLGRSLFDEKDASTSAVRRHEVAEVAGHRPEIGSYKNPILFRGESEHIGIGHSFQPGLMGRKKVDCRLTAAASSDDRIVEAGVRKKADH